MVEIRYGENYEVAGLAGQTIGEAREQYKSEFSIPAKAGAKLNGKSVKGNAELDTVLNDDDKLSFAVAKGKGAYLVGALLLALVATSSVFAFGFINASTTLNASIANSNFADVSINASSSTITWSAFGFFKGSIAGPKGLFDISPATGYNGDLVVTVSLGNADALIKNYRMLALKLDMIDSSGAVMDINESGGAGDTNTDWVMLTLDNGSVSMFPQNTTTNMTVRVKSGFYITNVFPNGGWGSGSASPDLFCEIAQR